VHGFRRDPGGEQEEDVVDAKHGDSGDWAVREAVRLPGFVAIAICLLLSRGTSTSRFQPLCRVPAKMLVLL